MSTLQYSLLTKARLAATPSTSDKNEPPGLAKWTDALSALVPAEVLAGHSAILSLTQATTAHELQMPGERQTIMFWSFIVCIIISILLYLIPKWKSFSGWDFARILFAPIAFSGWTMIQPVSAFDALRVPLGTMSRDAIAIGIAIGLGVLATWLANTADQTPVKRLPPLQ
jgi:hypothetical protein